MAALVLHFPLPFFHRLERISVSRGKSYDAGLSSPVIRLKAVGHDSVVSKNMSNGSTIQRAYKI